MKKFLSYFLIVFGIFAIVAYMVWFPSELEPPYRYLHSFGAKGKNPGQFMQPADIAIAGDNIFITDSGNARVQVLNKNGQFLYQFGIDGPAEQRLGQPIALSVFKQQVYVADGADNSIKVYSLQGDFMTRLAEDALKQAGLQMPTGLAIHVNGEIFVSNASQHRVIRLSADGQWLDQLGTGNPGSGADQFSSPADVAINQQGLLYTSDAGNKRVQVINDNGEFHFKWGGPLAMNIGGGFNGWFQPMSGIAVGPKGNVYVADPLNLRIQKFMSNGTYINSIALEDMDYTHLSLAVADNGDVYAVDYKNSKVMVWTPGKG